MNRPRWGGAVPIPTVRPDGTEAALEAQKAIAAQVRAALERQLRELQNTASSVVETTKNPAADPQLQQKLEGLEKSVSKTYEAVTSLQTETASLKEQLINAKADAESAREEARRAKEETLASERKKFVLDQFLAVMYAALGVMISELYRIALAYVKARYPNAPQ